MSVLDASAVLALLQKEPGGVVVASHLDGAQISTVNASEVGSRLVDAGLTVGAARASELRHVLAPRTGGTLALLANAPSGTDVAFVGHVGYHQLTDLATVWRSIPLSQPIEVVVMRRRSDEIPDDEPERVAWIHANWRLLDDWIAERREARGWASVAT